MGLCTVSCAKETLAVHERITERSAEQSVDILVS